VAVRAGKVAAVGSAAVGMAAVAWAVAASAAAASVVEDVEVVVEGATVGATADE
jgi:hypothetical protein